MKVRFCFAAIMLATTAPAFAAATSPQPQEIFYRAPSGKGTAIIAAARDGSNSSTLFSTSTGTLYFDVGAGDSGVIIVSTPTAIQKLTYAKNSSGVFVRTGLTTLLSGMPRATAVDLSPDGMRIAYRGGDGTHVMVYDLSNQTNVEWLSGPWAWDLVWARGGASIVVLEQSSPVDGRSHLYEVTAPGQSTEILNLRNMDRVEVSRTDGNVLLLSYNSEDGSQSLIGTWHMPDGSTPGGWVNPSLAGQAVANRGVLSCDDSYLIFGGSGHAGAQIWFTQTLPSGADVLINKVGSNAEPQSWSTCPTVAATSGPHIVRP